MLHYYSFKNPWLCDKMWVCNNSYYIYPQIRRSASFHDNHNTSTILESYTYLYDPASFCLFVAMKEARG